MQSKATFYFAGILLFFFSMTAFAQQSITGVVVENLSNETLSGASVTLLNSKDSVLLVNRSGTDGKFILKDIPDGNYTLQINFIGFNRHKQALVLHSSNKIAPLKIALDYTNTMLADVDINVAPMVVMKGDTTEFNASAFTTEPYADADALIAQLPGAEIDEEGKLKIQGEDVVRIMVDGREFFSSDPRIAMKTLPADIIDKIQIIDEKSDQANFTGFDDGERRKIMNIVTKPDRRHGYFGKVAGGYGNSDRFNTGGSINAFQGKRRLSFNLLSNNVNQQGFAMETLAGGETVNTGRGGRGGGGRGDGGSGIRETSNFASNYNNEWGENIKFNGNYSFNNTNNSGRTLLNREYLIGNKSNQFQIQNQENTGTNRSHQADFRFEYEIDSNNSISFRPNLRYQESSSISFSQNTTSLNKDQPINASIRNNDNTRDNMTVSGDFSYRRKLNNKGRTVSLSVNGSVNSNKGLAYNLSLNEYYKDYLLNRTDTINNENDTQADGNGLTGRLAYTERISTNSRLQANYSLRNTNSYSNRQTFAYLAETGQFGELNEQLSNEFRNEYLYHSAGLAYLFSVQKIRFDLGLDFQDARSKNFRVFPQESNRVSHFASYLPSASFTYRVSKQKNIQVNYKAATRAPNINQLQDVINNQNTLNVRVGNPELKQESGHQFSMNYKTANRESGGNFSVNVNADFTNDGIVNSTFLANQDTVLGPNLILRQGGRFTKPENIDGFYTLRSNASLGIPLKSLKMNINLSTGVFHTRDVGLLNNELTNSYSSGINQRVGINSKISQKIIVSVEYRGNYSSVENSANPDLSYNFYSQNIKNDFTLLFWKGVRTSSTFNYHYSTGLTNDDSQSFILWNASIGKKLFKRQNAEVSLTAYDLFNKNVNFSTNISDQFIEDRESSILNQYFILTFTYNLRKFGGAGAGNGNGGSRGQTMGGDRPVRSRG